MTTNRRTVVFVALADIALVVAAFLLPETKGTLALLASLIIITWIPIFTRQREQPINPRLLAAGAALLVLGLIAGAVAAVVAY